MENNISSNKKVDCTHFFNSIENPTIIDVLKLAINTVLYENAVPIRILVSPNDLELIKSINEKQICLADKDYYEFENIMVSELLFLEEGRFIIITDTNLIIQDKFSEVLTKIIKPQIFTGDFSTKSKIRFIEENEINFDKLTIVL